jgi:alpha-tubulin suppressor-like RCC1 family protein
MSVALILFLGVCCGKVLAAVYLPMPIANCGTLAVGASHTCVVSAELGKVRCWGSGHYGQLGYGSNESFGSSRATVPSSLGDVIVSSTQRVVQISAGVEHTCALLDNGAVRCWGHGAYGRLGYGDEISRSKANSGDVNVSAKNRVVQVSAGGAHTCALLDNGRVRCWGLDDVGQLGYGKSDYVGERKVLVPSNAGDVNVSGVLDVVQISAGWMHTCALLEDGSVRCWGRGSLGRLGYGSSETAGNHPANVPSDLGNVPISATHRAVQVSAGNTHTCALLSNGKVRCWGNGGGGRLGYGTSENVGDTQSSIPAIVGDVMVSPTAAVVHVSAGQSHSCALLDDGNVRCWGFGANGRLGYGNSLNVGDSNSSLPWSVGDISVSSENEVVQIFAGGYHTCALLNNGKVRCWGYGEFGQLGYGSAASVGDSIGALPHNAGDVSIGWKVSSECVPGPLAIAARSPSMTVASSPSQTSLPLQRSSRDMKFTWLIFGVIALAILCVFLCVTIGGLHLSRRRCIAAERPAELRRSTIVESPEPQDSTFSDSAPSSGSNVYSTAEIFHLSRMAGKGAAEDSRTSNNHHHYDTLQMKPKSRSTSRAYVSATAARSRSGSFASPARVTNRKRTHCELAVTGGEAQMTLPRVGGQYDSASAALRVGITRS